MLASAGRFRFLAWIQRRTDALRRGRRACSLASAPTRHAHFRAAEGLWATGDVNGQWPLIHVGKYEGEVVAANILGQPRKANYESVPRVVYTDPQAAVVGASAGRFSAMVPLSEAAMTATYTRARTPTATASSRCSATASD
jgi:pyruvate/2-oxoglutarate dehydrogenase complex dihydrolipoamide dehydrogenase (E3) component